MRLKARQELIQVSTRELGRRLLERGRMTTAENIRWPVSGEFRRDGRPTARDFGSRMEETRECEFRRSIRCVRCAPEFRAGFRICSEAGPRRESVGNDIRRKR